MSDEDCVGQVWECLEDKSVFVLLGRDDFFDDRWRALVIDSGRSGLSLASITWFGNGWFGSSLAKRIA